MESTALAELLPAVTTSAEETTNIGRRIAEMLSYGTVVALYGELGTGKTQLIKGICSGLGYPSERVHSPTFTIVNEYAAPSGPIYHFDAYRVEHLGEFYDLGYEDYFFGAGICLVEWADRVEPLIPAEALRLNLLHNGSTRRTIKLVCHTRGWTPTLL